MLALLATAALATGRPGAIPPVYGEGWRLSASAGEWTLRDHLGPAVVDISCPRLAHVGDGYVQVSLPKATPAPTAITFLRGGRTVSATYPLKPWHGAGSGQYVWSATSRADWRSLLSAVEALTLSDRIRLDGAGLTAVDASTSSLETIGIYRGYCERDRLRALHGDRSP